jgi:hypothetical protein
MERKVTGKIIGLNNSGQTLIRVDNLEPYVIAQIENFSPKGLGTRKRENKEKPPKTRHTRVDLILFYCDRRGPIAKEWALAA